MQDKKQIAIIGAGGHGKVVGDIILKQGGFELLGFIDTMKPEGTPVLNSRVIGNEEVILKLPPNTEYVVAIGDNWIRSQVVDRLRIKFPNISFTTLVHPSATVGSGVKIGQGTVIMAGAIINPATNIGEHVIVNTGAIVEHDNSIGDYSSIMPGVTLGGEVTLDNFVTVAIGATVKHGVKIGSNTVVGAGATVLNNLPENIVAYGIPAKIIRARAYDEPYLG